MFVYGNIYGKFIQNDEKINLNQFIFVLKRLKWQNIVDETVILFRYGHYIRIFSGCPGYNGL